jgi:diguanylate cyclase (GGDEF)-like protein
MNIEADINGLVELVSNVTEAYTTAVFLADNQNRMLRLWRFYSLSDKVNAKAKIPYGTGPIGIVAESKMDFDLARFDERDSDLLGIYAKNESIKSFFAVPILNKGGNLEGVISIDSKKSFVFANKEQKLLKLFAKQFADIINNLKIKNFLDTESSDIEFICNFVSKITNIVDLNVLLHLTLESLKRLVECESYFICLRTDDNESEFCIVSSNSRKDLQGLRFSDKSGLAGCVIDEKKSFLLGNRKDDFGSYVFTSSESLGRVRSFLGVPLILQNEVIGLICLIDDKEDVFRHRDQQVISIMADNVAIIIAHIKALARIESLSTNIDGLTGLKNFCGFSDYIELMFQSAKQKRQHLSLMILDIDNFRRHNERIGYKTGNEILKQIAQFLADNNHKSNINVTRYGSDEFAVIMPDIRLDHAYSIAEEVCLSIRKPMFILSNRDIDISVSIGVSCFSDNSKDKNELVNNALDALSIAKSRGGGIVWAMNYR